MIMNKSLYIVAFSLAFATTGMAQNNEGQDKTVDLGNSDDNRSYGRHRRYLPFIRMNWIKMQLRVLTMPYMACCRD